MLPNPSGLNARWQLPAHDKECAPLRRLTAVRGQRSDGVKPANRWSSAGAQSGPRASTVYAAQRAPASSTTGVTSQTAARRHGTQHPARRAAHAATARPEPQAAVNATPQASRVQDNPRPNA